MLHLACLVMYNGKFVRLCERLSSFVVGPWMNYCHETHAATPLLAEVPKPRCFEPAMVAIFTRKRSFALFSALFCALKWGVDKRVVFQKGGFGGCSPRTKTGTRVHSDVPPERKSERGYV